jgi:hypothetical protein
LRPGDIDRLAAVLIPASHRRGHKGKRYRLLRLLLGKMIAPLNSRYKDKSVVIGELEQIEIWERNAAGSLLDEVALQSAARLQQRITGELARRIAPRGSRSNSRKGGVAGSSSPPLPVYPRNRTYAASQ